MSIQDEFKPQNQNPAKRFLTWHYEGKLEYYDKAKKEKVFIDIPFKFCPIKRLHTVKGYNEPLGMGIYSNEIQNTTKDILDVKYFNGPKIARGLWRDIKDDVYNNKGYYVQSVYAIDENGELINIAFKGTNVAAWSEFLKSNWQRVTEEWVEIHSFTNEKKGTSNYTVPKFQLNRSLSEAEYATRDILYRDLSGYMDEYLTPSEKEITEQVYADAVEDANNITAETISEQQDDGLPF